MLGGMGLVLWFGATFGGLDVRASNVMGMTSRTTTLMPLSASN